MYNVAGMYYQAQIFKVQLRLLNDNYDRVKKITEVAENQYKNDLIKKLDLDQLYVNKRNLESDIQNAEMAYQQQINGLKILMGMSLKDSLSLVTDSLQADSKAYPAEFSVQNNIAQKLLNSQLEFQELQYQTNRAGYFPSLLLNASTSINGQFDKFKFDKQGSFNRFPNMLVGFTLNVPIFDGLKRSFSLKQKKVEIAKLNLDIEQTQNQLDIKYQNAVYTIDQNKIKLLQQTENLRFAQQLYDAVKFTYNEGLSGINELINAENGLKAAQNNYLASLLQIKLAELDELNIKGDLTQLIQ
jgi:outer membrane protein TolC